jgi:ketose-bisphosphate aldolase
MLKEAHKQGFAIPAFNYSDIWEFLAIVESAEQLEAPVFAASAMVTVNTVGLDYCAALGRVAFEKYHGKVHNHLDHCNELEICKRAVDCGYHSVMLDASRLPLETNITMTKEVVSYAHRAGVLVEAELGQILGRSDETAGFEEQAYERPTPESCVRLVRETGIDSLAIGIGNQHGFYSKEPKLNIGLLQEVHAMIDIPLVLHGSTGLNGDDVRRCIASGVSKVNVGTAIHYAYKTAIAGAISDDESNNGIVDLALIAKEAMKDVIRSWIRLCGAEGKRTAV